MLKCVFSLRGTLASWLVVLLIRERRSCSVEHRSRRYFLQALNSQSRQLFSEIPLRSFGHLYETGIMNIRSLGFVFFEEARRRDCHILAECFVMRLESRK